jgi:hypothetical protein
MPGLVGSTQYYARAYGTNSQGTGYGDSLPFIYLKTTTICGNRYTTENLALTNYANGDPIPLITDAALWAAATGGAYCYVNGNAANTPKFGLLYNGYATQDPRGLAPAGYRLMTYNDTKNCIGGGFFTGGALKLTGTVYWNPPNTGATNITQFSALGGGYRDATGTYLSFKDLGVFRFKQDLDSNGNPINNGIFQLAYNSSNLTYPFNSNEFKVGGAIRLIRL